MTKYLLIYTNTKYTKKQTLHSVAHKPTCKEFHTTRPPAILCKYAYTHIPASSGR